MSYIYFALTVKENNNDKNPKTAFRCKRYTEILSSKENVITGFNYGLKCWYSKFYRCNEKTE